MCQIKSWRLHLIAVFKQAGSKPTYEIGRAGDSTILYYEHLPSIEVFDEVAARTPTGILHNPQDKERFDDVLRATLELALVQKRGLTFIWCWGYSYDIDNDNLNFPEIKAGLEKHGLKFFTRHS